PLRGGGAPRRTACRPWADLIVPVFGLALAPYWRSAGCRARHRARALGASLDRYRNSLGDSRGGSQLLLTPRERLRCGDARAVRDPTDFSLSRALTHL